MALQYITTVGIWEEVSDTTVSTTVALNISAGDLLLLSTQRGESTTIISVNDGSGNNFTILSEGTRGGVIWQALGHVLGAIANASAYFTMTVSPAIVHKGFAVSQYRPDAGKIASLIAGPSSANGYGTAVQSGNITTGDFLEGVVFGGLVEYGYETVSAAQVIDQGADYLWQPDWTTGKYPIAVWGKIFNASQSGHGQCTLGASADWLCDILAIKSVAAGGPLYQGALPVGRRKMFYVV